MVDIHIKAVYFFQFKMAKVKGKSFTEKNVLSYEKLPLILIFSKLAYVSFHSAALQTD